MKTTATFTVLAMAGLGLLAGGCAHKPAAASKSLSPEAAAQLKTFVAEKEAQGVAAAQVEGRDASVFKPFFAAADRGNWPAISNAFLELRNHAGQYEHSGKPTIDERLHGTAWEGVKEIWGIYEAFSVGDEKYSLAFGTNIIASIPAGSIYFGGTDPGRWIVTALCKSQVKGDPFYVLTQNALADSTYLEYVRNMYGNKIYVPTTNDQQECFQDYIKDAKKRLQNQQLKPGENVRTDENGRVQVSGQIAVMQINGLLVKIIFDKNPDREFFVEESFPLDWMYPYLEPHGLIFKINRQPLTKLSDEIVERDHDYWKSLVAPMIGDWLADDTSVGEIAAFAQKTFGKHDFSGFTGDPRFIQNDYSHKMFSKLRSSLGGLYAWRLKNATGAAEKERMAREADLAFRQAWALCPYSPEAVYRYVNLLREQNRLADALLVAETAAQLPAMQGKDGDQVRTLVKQLKTANR
jgi:hypothetical protein